MIRRSKAACGGFAAAAFIVATLGSAATPTKTATNLDDINLNDTKEDPGYATAGEDLARATGADVVGKPAPLAVMKTIDGQAIDLGVVYGKKPVYIKFWATWCAPCRQQMPAFEKMYESLGDKMQIVAVNIGLSDDEASVRAFRSKYGLKMPIVIDDGRLGALFHLGVTPQHVLIGRDVRFAYVGHADNKSLADAIEAAMSSKPGAAPAVATVATAERVFKTGDRVSGLIATTTSGKKVSLGKSSSGRLRAVQFFSSWCEWYLEKSRPGTAQNCARTRAEIESLVAKNPKVDWIGIAGGPWATQEDLADCQKKHKVTIPLALDKSGALFRSFEIRDIPTIAIIDSAGRLVRLISPGEKDIAGAIRAAQAGTAGSNGST